MEIEQFLRKHVFYSLRICMKQKLHLIFAYFAVALDLCNYYSICDKKCLVYPCTCKNLCYSKTQ